MGRDKQKTNREIENGVEEFQKNKASRKSGITKQEWENIKTIITLNPRQEDFYKGIRNNTLSICQGPAGTAKTFVSCYAAIGLLADRKIERIILTKPIQESGEQLGFLPGTKEDKTDPYMQSYFSTFQKIIGKQSFEFMKSIGEVVVEPLAYMRGTTYDDCIMLLDEAQNCTMTQMMLWSTRLGRNSKAVMMGDISQYDIKKRDSKFLDFISIVSGEYEFKSVDGTKSQQDYTTKLSEIYSHKFEVCDIVRNKFLIDLVDRYEKYKFQNSL
jgi:phosphate starvation-inducible protein PhoH